MTNKTYERFTEIVDKATKLKPDTSLQVTNFGKNKDLLLKIHKDPLFDGSPSSNQVTIHINKKDVSLENTWFLDVSELRENLERYYNFDFTFQEKSTEESSQEVQFFL